MCEWHIPCAIYATSFNVHIPHLLTSDIIKSQAAAVHSILFLTLKGKTENFINYGYHLNVIILLL